MARRAVLVLTHLAALAVGAAGAVWLAGGGGGVRTADASPNGAYLLVTRGLSRWQQMADPGRESPGFAELYRTYDRAMMCQSEPVDFLHGGPVAWSGDRVAIGQLVEFAPFGEADGACRAARDLDTIFGPQAPPDNFLAAVPR